MVWQLVVGLDNALKCVVGLGDNYIFQWLLKELVDGGEVEVFWV